MKKTMKKLITLILTAMILTGCTPIIGSNNVFELDDVTIEVTQKTYTNTQWQVTGTITNLGDTTIMAPWYIEAQFYSDDNYTITFGGTATSFNYPLEPGVSAFWTIVHYDDAVVESNYPNFAVKNVRAYVEQ